MDNHTTHGTAIYHLVSHCGSLAAGERCLLVVDATTSDLADSFRVTAAQIGASFDLIEIDVADRHSKEPTADAASRMALASHPDLTSAVVDTYRDPNTRKTHVELLEGAGLPAGSATAAVA